MILDAVTIFKGLVWCGAWFLGDSAPEELQTTPYEKLDNGRHLQGQDLCHCNFVEGCMALPSEAIATVPDRIHQTPYEKASSRCGA